MVMVITEGLGMYTVPFMLRPFWASSMMWNSVTSKPLSLFKPVFASASTVPSVKVKARSQKSLPFIVIVLLYVTVVLGNEPSLNPGLP